MHARTQSRQPKSRVEAPLILRDVPGKGRGVFAGAGFEPGEEVLEFLGEVRDVSSFQDLTHALQIGPREFLSSSGGIDDYVNHSCQPNCGVRDDDGRVVLFALQTIAPGDEISFDYATTQAGGFFVFDCQCGSPACRGQVGDFADMPPQRQAFFINRRALLRYLYPLRR